MALIGVAGTFAWRLIRGTKATPTTAALLVLCFLTPLLNTWPFRVFDSARASMSPGLWALTCAPSVLVLFAAAFHRGWRNKVSRLFLASATLITVAAFTSSLASAHPGAAASIAWISLVVPAGFGLLVAQSAVIIRQLPAISASPSSPQEFRVRSASRPISSSSASRRATRRFAATKALLYRPHLFQEVTFGNVDHLTVFALLMIAPAVSIALSAFRGLCGSRRLSLQER